MTGTHANGLPGISSGATRCGTSETGRERRAVAVVAVEELDDACGLAEAEGALERVRPVERVDEPDLPVGGERVRGARHRLVDDPAEAVGAEVVAEAELAPLSSRARAGRRRSRAGG